MCRLDFGDGSFEVSSVRVVRRARRGHRCVECARQIEPGWSYVCTGALFDGAWTSYAHCVWCWWAGAWLVSECGGFTYDHGQIEEELVEHWQGEFDHPIRTLALGRRIVAMRRRFWRFDKTGLMTVPTPVAA